MSIDFPSALFINGFTLALATAFLLIILWYDIRRTVNQFFALFLILVQLWSIGFFLTEVVTLIDAPPQLFNIGYAISQAGFVGSSVSLYALMTVIAGVQPRRFRFLTTTYLVIGIGYSILTSFASVGLADTTQSRIFSGIFFFGFDLITLYVTWRYRRKFDSLTLIIGNFLFVLGQGITFINPNLGVVTLATSFTSVGALAISIAIVRRELINPLLERGTQLETMHEVSVAIAKQSTTDSVLKSITEQASQWLNADASGIFLKKENYLQLVAIHNLPTGILDLKTDIGTGVAGRVAENNQSIYLENYARDWQKGGIFDFAQETFGSLICVPLNYANDVIGVLMVVSGIHGTLFEKEDVRRLELLAGQATVAIAQANLFAEQKSLTTQLSVAHQQLQTVLSSTENPVIAVDRQLNIIFTNPAAESVFGLDTIHSRENLTTVIPSYALPTNYSKALKSIRYKGSFTYEIEVDNTTYLCQVASLGENRRVDGFVAILNDVSELKELDRIKSEMVRMTSHDLKNPLQAAFANLELLRDDVDEINDDEIALSVDNIENQLNKMNRIISGILDLERVRIGSTLSEICQPKLIIEDAVAELADIARQQQITLETDIADNLYEFLGDIDQFKRAIVNLIENAIKFSSSEGRVIIKAENIEKQIHITVEDNGIGIPEDLQAKIFDRFYRGHQQGAEHISGSGLGLSLVKAVIESHNGKIWLTSQATIGTTFYVTIPAMEQKVYTAS
ncbi:MAG: hypothetical protein Phog2KO_16310 [Phototrophicaceae bacterium]